MKKAMGILLDLAAIITALAGILCMVMVIKESLCELCSCCALKEKLPSKDEIIKKMPWRRAEIESEFADYAD